MSIKEHETNNKSYKTVKVGATSDIEKLAFRMAFKRVVEGAV